uniref:Ovule protein n=1 Tax=Brugia timori TaxID=42155 RepID=A0A0R3QCY1_9BILA
LARIVGIGEAAICSSGGFNIFRSPNCCGSLIKRSVSFSTSSIVSLLKSTPNSLQSTSISNFKFNFKSG